MSYYKTFDKKGIRHLEHRAGFSISAPAGHKYITQIAMHLHRAWFEDTFAYWAQRTAGHQWEGSTIGVPGTDDLSALAGNNPTEVFTPKTPFIIKGGTLTVKMRNNYNKAAVVTMMKVRPRHDLGTAIEDGITGLSSGSWIPAAIAEGLADKLSLTDVATHGSTMIHSGNPTNGTVIPYNQLYGVLPAASTEVSFNPMVTVYDSRLFTENFRVVKQDTVKLRPKDSAVFKYKLGGLSVLDGTDALYGGGSILLYTFTEIYLAQVVGTIGHVSAYADTGLEALEDPSTSRHAARRQSSNVVMEAACFIDVQTYAELDIEVFLDGIILPGKILIQNTAYDANNMADTVIQAVDDLE